MSRVIAWVLGCLASAIVTATTANAQTPTGERAPVPRQVLTAKSVLIANGASESYGADSYFQLTVYDGGPNRAYNSFYSALHDWGHFDLVGETADADLVLVVKFRNPVVGREGDREADRTRDWVYDPQLNLSINDPRTGLPLWTITEHIEPGGNHAEANGRFDEAVTRLVADLQRLILQPDLATETDNPPPGAIATARREARERHAGAGLLIGGAIGGIIAMKDAGGHDPCADLGNFEGCMASSKRSARNQILASLGLALAGALVGWAWPVDY